MLLLVALFGNHDASLRLYKVGEGLVRSLLGHQQVGGNPFSFAVRISLFSIKAEFSLKQDWREGPWTPSPPG